MKLFKLLLLSIFLLGCEAEEIIAQEKRTEVIVENQVFKVWYNEVKEQPVKLIYTSTNRTKNVDRGNMNFYTESEVYTSNNADYYNNIWDKGHLAPAATYSDSMVNLKQTFSFLNCVLQEQNLNRGEWRLLEEQERKWDDEQDLIVTVKIEFSDSILPTGANIPNRFIKCIEFKESKNTRCFSFPNVKPTKGWEEHEVEHDQG